MESNRYYLERGPYRSHLRAQHRFEDDLEADDSSEMRAWLTDDEFLRKYRMPREAFDQLLELIKDDPVFERKYWLEHYPSTSSMLEHFIISYN